MPRKAEVPTLFQYQNEPKSLFISQFNHNPGSIRSIKPTPQGCIVNLDYCLAPDTMVELINNERDTIKSICERVTSGEDLYTYSINPDTEEIEVSKIVAGRQTRKNEPTLKITLDNGETIVSSYNHKFLLRNGKYVPAEELEVNTSLMSLNTDTPYKIISIEPYEPMDLYDIEVEKYHNFALTSGVFVHNSQLELRIAGVISGDKVLEEVYKSGIDLHIATASKTFGVPIEEVTKDLRTKAKGVGFGRIKLNLVIQ